VIAPRTLRVPLGRLLITPAALAVLPMDAAAAAVVRHARGDWGDLAAHDWAVNEAAAVDGDRLLSAYTAEGVRFWIITEADRSVTTVLLPSDY
jgi:hypothetical protein